jgi:hypothetical protein
MCFIHNALHFINQVTALIDFQPSVSNTQRMEKFAGESIGQRVRRIREYNEWSLVTGTPAQYRILGSVAECARLRIGSFILCHSP